MQVSIPRCWAGHWTSDVQSPGFNKESAYDQGSSRKCWRTFLVFLHLEEVTGMQGKRGRVPGRVCGATEAGEKAFCPWSGGW